jgi:hypothetical protein
VYVDRARDMIGQSEYLSSVNFLLWEAEDLVQDLPGAEMSKLAWLAKGIAKWNANHAELVQKLNELYGETVTVEKIYGK